MTFQFSVISGFILTLFIAVHKGSTGNDRMQDDNIECYITDPVSSTIAFYWKDDNGNILGSIKNLKEFVESKHEKLLFAMNGGMYTRDNTPQGLYIDNYKTIVPLDTNRGDGNFYLKPNGVFYINEDNRPGICSTRNFKNNGNIKWATQSGPMLLIDGEYHPAFKKSSNSLYIRNGVGILPGGRIVFAISKEKINFYHFADYFKRLGCRNALYLDGFVSRIYLPGKLEQLDGNFGVIIGITASR